MEITRLKQNIARIRRDIGRPPARCRRSWMPTSTARARPGSSRAPPERSEALPGEAGMWDYPEGGRFSVAVPGNEEIAPEVEKFFGRELAGYNHAV